MAGLVLGEFAARVMLNPSDYLSVEMVRDEVLGAVPSASAKARGFDAWGFRNPERLERKSLVLLGDLVSVYLAVLRGVDPTPVPGLDELKSELAGAG